MNPPTLFARHEAAHAVVAVSLGLPITEVTIAPGMLGDRQHGGCVRLGDVTKDWDNALRMAMAALAARAEVSRYKWTGDIPDGMYAIDEEIVQEAAEWMAVPVARYDEWRSLALEFTLRVLALVWVTDAIEAVAAVLDKDTTIQPEVVESLVNLCQNGLPEPFRHVELDDDFMKRIGKVWS